MAPEAVRARAGHASIAARLPATYASIVACCSSVGRSSLTVAAGRRRDRHISPEFRDGRTHSLDQRNPVSDSKTYPTAVRGRASSSASPRWGQDRLASMVSATPDAISTAAYPTVSVVS